MIPSSQISGPHRGSSTIFGVSNDWTQKSTWSTEDSSQCIGHNLPLAKLGREAFETAEVSKTPVFPRDFVYYPNIERSHQRRNHGTTNRKPWAKSTTPLLSKPNPMSDDGNSVWHGKVTAGDRKNPLPMYEFPFWFLKWSHHIPFWETLEEAHWTFDMFNPYWECDLEILESQDFQTLRIWRAWYTWHTVFTSTDFYASSPPSWVDIAFHVFCDPVEGGPCYRFVSN